jgi:hypothetical protein
VIVIGAGIVDNCGDPSGKKKGLRAIIIEKTLALVGARSDQPKAIFDESHLIGDAVTMPRNCCMGTEMRGVDLPALIHPPLSAISDGHPTPICRL